MTGPAVEKRIIVKNLKIFPPLALAPMVGLSHTAMRSLVQEQGGVGLLFTEMLAARSLPDENERHSPLLIRSATEKPLFYQLFLNEIDQVEPAVRQLLKFDAHGIDLNLGCPAPKLRKQGAGCYLVRDHKHLSAVVARLRKATDLPLSAKIRLGDQLDTVALASLCRMLEGEGIDLLTVHGRLHGEKFCRKPRWDWIGKVKDMVSIPVLANGGIFSVEDARICLRMSQADGLMVGRGAAWRPWLLADIGREIYGIPDSCTRVGREQVYFRFIELLTERFPRERRLGRLKQFTHYFAGTYTFGHHLATAVQTSDSVEQAAGRAKEFFDQPSC
ncbi:MAG: tRNA-dihydrouridine synthase family protein [Desulfocapsaceae bacterium]|nr:tRNA-dihydrouridine synthase family protein [Desulfocapsaceae bacterium]